ncbi:LysR family transcriptional regulator [Alsobacter metallidurans]|uniref:LysR family transcriptional regulator n=1 Tax=Alsobacter metallidurans TaxID=340221 RepID=A0A917MKD7_9HYPH|nr:LysR family transcriptional regulator [Alsobacter metallidurans]GGH32162.1 LysR family transcriptional regulator [Alsobacter metallidurans]
MRFTIAQIEAFFWTARLGSLSRAASHLHMAQPTISLRLRDLEAALAVKLFARNGRGLALTADGLALLPRASALLEEADRITLQTDPAVVTGSIRVGFAEGFAMTCLPTLLETVRADHPLLKAEYVVSISYELERELSDRHLDLAVLVNPTGRNAMRLVPLGVQDTAWAASVKWGLGPQVRPSDLHHLPIVSNPPRSAMFRQIKDWFATAGLEPSRLDICSSVAVIGHLVSSGAALGVLPVRMIEPEVEAGRVQVLRPTPDLIHGRVYASYPEGGLTAPVNSMLKSIQKALATINYLKVNVEA